MSTEAMSYGTVVEPKQDQIAKMAKQCCPTGWWGNVDHIIHAGLNLEKFAELVAAAEREACAKHFERLSGTEWFAENVAEEIRARGTP